VSLEVKRCYNCGVEVREYALREGERPLADQLTWDHVPPRGLFNSPRPSNLISVPCCFVCNNKHSGFDERLRICASMPFDRNESGQRILNEKVFEGTVARGRQQHFLASIGAAMKPVPGEPELVGVSMNLPEFNDGIIRMTKGLLCTAHPTFNYYSSKFTAISISSQSSPEQLKLMGLLKRATYFERGERTFQCWYFLDVERNGGAWMLVFYECFGFFVFHADGPEFDRLIEKAR